VTTTASREDDLALTDHPGSTEALLARAQAAPEPERTSLVERVVLDHLSTARSLAWRYRDKGENFEDLVQVAYLGLVKAARGYRPGEGHSFAAYAVPTVTGELRRHFRDKGWDVRPPRRLQELRVRIRDAEERLGHDLGRTTTAAELARELEVTVEDIEQTRSASAGYSAVSLDAPVGGDAAGMVLGDLLPAEEPDDSPEMVLDSMAVEPLLAALPPRDQLILAMRYFRGCTQQQIADEIGVTQMQVSRLIRQALDSLRRELEAGACS
jgi:RNA polymerase sigma-B factor